MPKVTYPDGIAIWKLIYYTPAFVASIWVSWRHGFGKSSGWIFLAIFSLIRIINSSAQIATISSQSTTTETIALVTGFLGLSPLLLASLGILARVYYTILKSPWNMIFSLIILKAVQTPAAIALVLCIVGATSANTPDQVLDQSTTRAGIIIYLVVFLALVLLTLGAALGRRMTQRGEGILLAAVALSLPLLLLRIIYSMLASFSGSKTFNPVTGSTTAELLMASVEEMIIVLIYIWAGLASESVPQDSATDSHPKKLLYRFGRGDFGGGKLGIVSLGAAIVGMILGNSKRERKPEGPESPKESRSEMV